MMNLLYVHIDGSAVNAFTLTVGAIGVIVVFVALVVLSVVFTQMPNIINLFKRKNKKSTKKEDKTATVAKEVTTANEGEITGEVSAAISLALHMYYNDMHDYESSVVTMEKTKVRRQSPWSSKALTVKSFKR